MNFLRCREQSGRFLCRAVVLVLFLALIFLFLVLFSNLTPSFESDLMESRLTKKSIELCLRRMNSEDIRAVLRSDRKDIFINYVWQEYEERFKEEKTKYQSMLTGHGFSFNDTLADIKKLAENYTLQSLMIEIDSPEFIVYARLVSDKNSSILSNREMKQNKEYAALSEYIELLAIHDGSIDEADVQWINQKRFANRTLESFWIQEFNQSFMDAVPDFIPLYSRSYSN